MCEQTLRRKWVQAFWEIKYCAVHSERTFLSLTVKKKNQSFCALFTIFKQQPKRDSSDAFNVLCQDTIKAKTRHNNKGTLPFPNFLRKSQGPNEILSSTEWLLHPLR